MTAGVGLFGILSGFIASWFLTPTSDQQDSELRAVRNELAAIRQMLEHSERAA